MSDAKKARRRRAPMLFAPLAAAVVTGLALTAPASAATAGSPSDWSMGGQNISDTHYNAYETTISSSNASKLTTKWTFKTAGDVSATPAVVGGDLYFPDWGGYLNAVDKDTGALVWRQPISAYDGIPGAVSRTSPAVVNGVVYIGDQNGAHLMAINAKDGKLIWITQLDTHPQAVLTESPLVYNGVVYEGVSSLEEGAAANPSYPCCTFRGSMTAVNAATGQIQWKTYTVPDNGGVPGGYSGGAVWGSTPAIDPASNTLFITTGNNYTIPASVTACENAGGTPDTCLDPNDHIDSIMALDVSTGAVKWADGQGGFDTWTVGCITSGANCPPAPDAGPDADFGSGPNLFTINNGGHKELVVGAGEKSGQYWAADAATGTILWGTQVGPGSSLGGMEWGSSTDGTRIYVAEANLYGIPYTPAGSTTPITGGSWAALNPATGKIEWQTPDPLGNVDTGAVSSANGVVYAGSLSGHMYAMNAATGQILWDFTGQGSSVSGAAIVDGVVYWGNGYSHLGPGLGTASTTFYAFKLGK
jgi:polyvinyl alcohol dehydrogenase (cytochrome)